MEVVRNMKEIFPIIPASSGPVWFFLGLSVFLLALVALFGYLTYSSRHARCEVSADGLRIAGDLYGRRIPLEALRLDGARVLDLRRDKEYQLKWRTNGAGLPGYSAGWFKLRNGEKSLAFVTDKQRVLYLPTSRGYSLLLSLAEPEALLEALRTAGARAQTVSP